MVTKDQGQKRRKQKSSSGKPRSLVLFPLPLLSFSFLSKVLDMLSTQSLGSGSSPWV